MSRQSLIDALLGLFFPDRCGGCQRLGDLFCGRCRAALIPYPAGDRRFPESLTDVWVAYVFESPLREALHQFKYSKGLRLARPLGALLGARLSARRPAIDAVMPVPLHASRQAERGYNQAAALAREVAAALGAPLLDGGLARVRATEQQARLEIRARAENVRGAFRWQSAAAAPRRVLLIDDVLTTGATAGACAEALRAASTEIVYAAALARSRATPS